ncbi:hypothetical protein WJX84_007937 [Apatococcus fuscideae]|uniref:Amidase domain-containing protein n=1 Tax=Apatococcus fuscideae TaxID=2026836 RepID=A0AAW1RI57_9CHLO
MRHSTAQLLLLTPIIISSLTAAQPNGFLAGKVLYNNYTQNAITVIGALTGCTDGSPAIPVVELTIDAAHQAMLTGRLTCTQLLSAYVQRINRYDPTGTNAVRALSVTLVADGLAKDAQLQQVIASNGTLDPLFCVPLVVKDNIDLVGLATTAGAQALLDNFPAQDATIVAKAKRAGAVILAKVNLSEWAFSATTSIGSVFGVVRNAYAFDREAGGSSGGTGASVAANLAMIGFGTDTGGSIRDPAAFNYLVGLRPSLGLTSRTGIVPLDLSRDIGGPIGRTVRDVAKLFTYITGYDATDPLTNLSTTPGAVPAGGYEQFLVAGSLKGKRIGTLDYFYDTTSADPGVLAVYNNTLLNLTQAGATVVRNVRIAGNSLGSRDWTANSTLTTNSWFTGFGAAGKWESLNSCGARLSYDLGVYLGSHNSTFKTLQQIVDSGLYHPVSNASLVSSLKAGYNYGTPADYPTAAQKAAGIMCSCGDFNTNPCRVELTKAFTSTMDSQALDALIYPTFVNSPTLLGDGISPSGLVQNQVTPQAGLPTIDLPQGLDGDGLPVSLSIVGRQFSEPTLLSIAYGFEQLTKYRSPPGSFPECTGPANGFSIVPASG